VKRLQLSIPPGALLIWSLLLFTLDRRESIALLLAVSVHELGHMAAMKAMGIELHTLGLEFCGLKMEYDGHETLLKQAAAAAAGPAAGLILALLLSRFGGERAALAAGLSLLLSLFNLIPVPPLDGGTLSLIILCALFGKERGERLQQAISATCSIILIGVGLYFLLRGWGAGLLAAASAIAVYRLRAGKKAVNFHRAVI